MRSTEDDGFSLVEMNVAMSIMLVAMVMFTSGILAIFRAANQNEAISTAQSQIHQAFQRLDKEIRYAAEISVPAKVGSDSYVEYLITNTGTAICTELRLNVAKKQLQRRTWTQGATVASGGWLPLASNVTSATPFTFIPADATDLSSFQRLRLQLTATAGSGNHATSATTDVTFTALNTSRDTSSATTCVEGRAAP